MVNVRLSKDNNSIFFRILLQIKYPKLVQLNLSSELTMKTLLLMSFTIFVQLESIFSPPINHLSAEIDGR